MNVGTRCGPVSPADSESGLREYDRASLSNEQALPKHWPVVYAVLPDHGIASVYAALTNIDGSFARPITAAWLFGIVWGMFSLLGIYLMAAYARHRLTVTETDISDQGVLRQKTISFAHLNQVTWKLIPQNGSLVMQSPTSKFKIAFANYDREDRLKLIPLLKERVANIPESGWDRFNGPWWAR